MQRHAGVQLGLRTHLEPEIIGLARIKNLFNHLAQLIDLDGEDSPVAALELKLGDGIPEGVVQVGHPVAQNVLETDEQRKFQIPLTGLLDDVRNLDGSPFVAQRSDHHVSSLVHIEVTGPPSVDIVEGTCSGDVPRSGGSSGDRFRFAHV